MTTTPKNWYLIESPHHSATLSHILQQISPETSGILLRQGTGLHPFVLIPEIRKTGVTPGLFLHFRDLSEIAMRSELKTIKALGIRFVFWGDPAPVQEAGPSQISDGPMFLKSLRKEFTSDLAFGVCNRGSHPSDKRLLNAYIQAGITIVALPHQTLSTCHHPGIEPWLWTQALKLSSHPGTPVLFDLTHLSEADLSKITL